MSTTAGEVIAYLESIAPLHLQESYDNSGLLVGSPEQPVTGVLVSLDCTEAVLDEAVARGCNLIISHHPAIFSGLRQLTGRTYTERVVIQAIRSNLIVYAIHTNLDNVLRSGVNERIAQKLGLHDLRILRPAAGQDNGDIGAGLVGELPDPVSEVDFLAHVKNRMQTVLVRHTALSGSVISRVAVCGGSGSFLLNEAKRAGAQAFITADYKYHQFFDADGDILICDIGHYESEQFTIDLIQELILSKFSTFAAHCTGINTNPVQYFT